MIRHYVNVISECGIDGALWPRIVFIDEKGLAVDKVFHKYTMRSTKPGGLLWHSFRCLIRGKTMNVTFERESNKWFLSQHNGHLYY